MKLTLLGMIAIIGVVAAVALIVLAMARASEDSVVGED
jgi:hypothetical protein